MNSLLQQLYHAQDFSLPLLGLVPDRRAGGGGADGGQTDDPLQEEDAVLLQLQVCGRRLNPRPPYDRCMYLRVCFCIRVYLAIQ